VVIGRNLSGNCSAGSAQYQLTSLRSIDSKESTPSTDCTMFWSQQNPVSKVSSYSTRATRLQVFLIWRKFVPRLCLYSSSAKTRLLVAGREFKDYLFDSSCLKNGATERVDGIGNRITLLWENDWRTGRVKLEKQDRESLIFQCKLV
jgi:hypothetical protein